MIIGVALALLAAGEAEPYAWPLDLPRALTSSFAEYRPGRFHAGIDLRTGPVGKPVHAPEAGHVSRIRCSPWGYGKAVYIALDDGNTAVFAHLGDFSPALSDFVRRAQHKNRSYTVDLYPPANQFRVARGEVVARSGRTGIGAPHLHYELRDKGGRPFQPRLVGITWPDRTAPTPKKVLVAPQGPEATVNGAPRPAVLTCRRSEAGLYTCPAITASGKIGFGIDIIDPANGGTSRLGVYSVTTTAGGQDVFLMRNDRLLYDNNHNAAVAYHPFLHGQGRFLLQYRWPGNVCDAYSQTENDGWFTVPLEDTEVRIETRDSAGNAATVVVPVRFDTGAPVPEPINAPGGGTGEVELECYGDWLYLSAEFDVPQPEAPELHVSSPGSSARPFARTDAKTFHLACRPEPGTTTLRVVHPSLRAFERTLHAFRRGGPARSQPLKGVTVDVAPESPYGTLLLMQEPSVGALPRLRGRLVGEPTALGPEDTPIDVPLRLTFPVPPNVERPERVHIYQAGGSGWRCLATERTEKALAVTTRSLGVFAPIEDITPPTIGPIRIIPQKNAPARPRISAAVRDVGSGLHDIAVFCGEQWLLMAYDPEEARIEWERDEDLPAGKHAVVFTLTDGAGNVTREERPLTIGTG